jgi:transcriptional regulator with XRE-family HTH domain
VDARELGGLVRSVRRKLGHRQADVAVLAEVDQGAVSRLERGDLGALRFATVRKVCDALEITLGFTAYWRGGQLPRLLDRDHAALVDWVVRELTRAGWQSLVEYTVNVYGERGSVDVIGWHAATRTLLIVEVKSRIVDQQDLFAKVHRKCRIVPGELATERGWRAAAVGVLLVVSDTTFNRDVVTNHRATFDLRFRARSREIRQWLAAPSGALGGVWFARSSAQHLV